MYWWPSSNLAHPTDYLIFYRNNIQLRIYSLYYVTLSNLQQKILNHFVSPKAARFSSSFSVPKMGTLWTLVQFLSPSAEMAAKYFTVKTAWQQVWHEQKFMAGYIGTICCLAKCFYSKSTTVVTTVKCNSLVLKTDWQPAVYVLFNSCTLQV